MMLALATSAHAGVYKWVDSEGNVHYADRPPTEGAVEVDLPEPSRYSPRVLGTTAKPEPSRGSGMASSDGTYSSFSIESPRHESTVRDDEGRITVALSLTPELKSGDYIQLTLDGSTLSDRLVATSTQLNGIERGRHEVQARLFDKDGSRLAETNAIVFYMRQTNLEDKARAEELERQRLFDAQKQREDVIEAERRAQDEKQRKDQAEQDAKVEALRRQGDFRGTPGLSPVLRDKEGFTSDDPDPRRFSRGAGEQFKPRDRTDQQKSVDAPDPIRRETSAEANPPPGSGSIQSRPNNPAYAPAPPGGISPAFRPPSPK